MIKFSGNGIAVLLKFWTRHETKVDTKRLKTDNNSLDLQIYKKEEVNEYRSNDRVLALFKVATEISERILENRFGIIDLEKSRVEKAPMIASSDFWMNAKWKWQVPYMCYWSEKDFWYFTKKQNWWLLENREISTRLSISPNQLRNR